MKWISRQNLSRTMLRTILLSSRGVSTKLTGLLGASTDQPPETSTGQALAIARAAPSHEEGLSYSFVPRELTLHTVERSELETLHTDLDELRVWAKSASTLQGWTGLLGAAAIAALIALAAAPLTGGNALSGWQLAILMLVIGGGGIGAFASWRQSEAKQSDVGKKISVIKGRAAFRLLPPDQNTP